VVRTAALGMGKGQGTAPRRAISEKRADRAGPETYYVSVMDIWRHRASKLVFVLVGVGDNDEASLPSFLGLCA
jgi:hypothetical protein